MITDYIGGEGSAETPKNDYVIYGWPHIVIKVVRMATKWRKAYSSLFQNSPRLPQSLHLLARKHMQRPTRRQIIPVDSEFWGIKANSRQSFSLLVVQHECQGSKTNATIYFPATPTRDGAKMQWFDQISNIVWSSGWHSCRAQTPTRGRKQHHLIFLLNLKLVKNNLHNFKKLFPTSFLCPLSGKSVQTCSSETRQTLYIWKRTNKSRSSIYNYIWMNRHIWIHNLSNLEYSDFRNISTHPAFIPALHSCTFMRSARQ